MRSSVRSVWRQSIVDSLSWQSPIALVSRPFWRNPSLVRPGARLRPRTALGLVLLVLLLTAAGWLYLVQADMMTETRQAIKWLGDQQESLVRDIRFLQVQMAQQTAMEQVYRHAHAMRLRPADRVEILMVPPIDRNASVAQAR